MFLAIIFGIQIISESWPNWPSKWLNVFGRSGSGKTHPTKILEKKNQKCKNIYRKDINNNIIPLLENFECIIIDDFKNNIDQKYCTLY